MRAFDVYEFENVNGFTICVVADFTTGCDVNFFAAAYLNQYDPNDMCANYLADIGTSVSQPFSFEVPPLSPFVIVVTEVFEATPCASYSFELCGLSCEADLELSKIEDPDPVVQNMPLTYTIKVRNNGPDSAGPVIAEDTLPSGVTVNSVSSSQGGLTQSVNMATFDIGELDPGAEATMTIEVTPNDAGVISNTVEVSAPQCDPDMSDNTDSVETAVLADSDGDGVIDDNDPCPLDAADDSDGDGVCDSDDQCPGQDDTIDADADGTPDTCDETPTGSPFSGGCCGSGALPLVLPALLIAWKRRRVRCNLHRGGRRGF
jgi:uncharacterized repeat protein (TIGR01451 family)